MMRCAASAMVCRPLEQKRLTVAAHRDRAARRAARSGARCWRRWRLRGWRSPSARRRPRPPSMPARSTACLDRMAAQRGAVGHVEGALPALGQGRAGGGDDDGLVMVGFLQVEIRMNGQSVCAPVQQAVVEADHVRQVVQWRCARRCRAGASGPRCGRIGEKRKLALRDAVEVRESEPASIRPGATSVSGRPRAPCARAAGRPPSRSSDLRQARRGSPNSPRLTSMPRRPGAAHPPAPVDRVAGQDAEVDHRLGLAGQHVFLVAGVRIVIAVVVRIMRVGARPGLQLRSTSGPSATGWTAPPAGSRSAVRAPRWRTSRPPTPRMPRAAVLRHQRASAGSACRWRSGRAGAASTNGRARPWP
jgi:hypothetical protein